MKTLLFLKPMSIKYQWEMGVDSWDSSSVWPRDSEAISDGWKVGVGALGPVRIHSEFLGLPFQTTGKPSRVRLECLQKNKRGLKMLIKRHLRNLYKASSVMIYMQMNLSVPGIHYLGFSNLIKSMLIVKKKYTHIEPLESLKQGRLVHPWFKAEWG